MPPAPPTAEELAFLEAWRAFRAARSELAAASVQAETAKKAKENAQQKVNAALAVLKDKWGVTG